MQHPNWNETLNKRENLILWIFLKDIKNLISGTKRLLTIMAFHSLKLETKQNKTNHLQGFSQLLKRGKKRGKKEKKKEAKKEKKKRHASSVKASVCTHT